MTSILIFLYLNYSKSIFLGDSGNYLISSVTALIILKENFYNPGSYYAEEIFLLFLIPQFCKILLVLAMKYSDLIRNTTNHIYTPQCI